MQGSHPPRERLERKMHKGNKVYILNAIIYTTPIIYTTQALMPLATHSYWLTNLACALMK